MRAKDYLSDSEIVELAQADATSVGQAMLSALQRERRRIEEGLNTDARINPERIEDDIRFHLGMMRGLEFLSRLRECARRELGISE